MSKKPVPNRANRRGAKAVAKKVVKVAVKKAVAKKNGTDLNEVVKKIGIHRRPAMPAVVILPEEFLAVLFDTETTGLVENRTVPLDKQPEVIEFYACAADLKTGTIKAEVEMLIKPSRLPLPPKITQITGITDEMLEDKSPFSSFAPSIKKLIAGAPLMIAHNVRFDMDMVEIEFDRLEEKIVWPRMLCTVEQTVHIKSHRLNMGALYQYLFNENFKGAHRAKADVAGLLRCCVELHKRGMLQ